jgi:predicted protein tyrosine phosphatase
MSNLLFVCSRNQWRSPTAEKIYRDKGYSSRSAGTSPKAKHSISTKDIQWADLIFVMEKKHKSKIIANFGKAVERKTIHILDIPDEYQFMDPLLISHLEDVMKPYL